MYDSWLVDLWAKVLQGSFDVEADKKMRVIGIVVLMLVPSILFAADVDDVRQVVQKFYTAYDEGFVKPVDFATEDWYHINPYGGVLPGLEATLKDEDSRSTHHIPEGCHGHTGRHSDSLRFSRRGDSDGR